MSLFFDLIDYAQKNNCSDLHLSFDSPPVFRKNGELFLSDFGYDFKKNNVVHFFICWKKIF
ncbi:MAG: hypothetical protein IJU86_02730 [Firmicutes bacterium]|nr:hypothetical protein [Bacillota bacterium]